MKSLIILYAHGSKDPRWRGTFECFTNGISKSLEGREVKLAYMEFVSPTLMEIVEDAYQGNCKTFTLIPLFMAGGAHVGRDLPEQVAEVMKKFPDICIDIKPPIGEHPGVFEAMKEAITNYAAA